MHFNFSEKRRPLPTNEDKVLANTLRIQFSPEKSQHSYAFQSHRKII